MPFAPAHRAPPPPRWPCLRRLRTPARSCLCPTHAWKSCTPWFVSHRLVKIPLRAVARSVRSSTRAHPPMAIGSTTLPAPPSRHTHTGLSHTAGRMGGRDAPPPRHGAAHDDVDAGADATDHAARAQVAQAGLPPGLEHQPEDAAAIFTPAPRVSPQKKRGRGKRRGRAQRRGRRRRQEGG